MPGFASAPSRRAVRLHLATLLCAGLLAIVAVPARAQLGLPGVGAGVGGLPGGPGGPGGQGGLGGVGGLGGLGDRVGTLGSGAGAALERSAQQRVAIPATELRRRVIDTLLTQHRTRLEADPAGEPVVRSELLLVSPRPTLLSAALARGYRLLREETLEGLDLRSVVLQPPAAFTTAEALAWLRSIDPAVDADFNHVYLRSGTVEPGALRPGAARAAVDGTPPAPVGRRVGLIDSGVDFAHPALSATPHRLWGCNGAPVPSPHGTAVASLLVGRDAEFQGVLPGAQLHAADVYCGTSPDGGSAEAVAQALAWMVRERVPVVNVSLVGAANRLVERAVQALHERGHLIVAAVGNDGPAAAPLYPAAYPGVVGITGTTVRRQVLPEAAQGPQVMFAAPGADVAVAQSTARHYVRARGTSFAAPLVAGLLADALPAPDPDAARSAVQALARRAADLGRPGRDTVYGHGWLGGTPKLQLAARD